MQREHHASVTTMHALQKYILQPHFPTCKVIQATRQIYHNAQVLFHRSGVFVMLITGLSLAAVALTVTVTVTVAIGQLMATVTATGGGQPNHGSNAISVFTSSPSSPSPRTTTRLHHDASSLTALRNSINVSRFPLASRSPDHDASMVLI
jgi:hypothetical protein